MNNQANPGLGLEQLCNELKSVVEKYKGDDRPEVRKSAISFGKIVDHVVHVAVTQGSTSLAVTTAGDLMEKHKSASPDGQSAPAVRDIDWAIHGLTTELRGMLKATKDPGARDLIEALLVAIAGALQVVEHGGTGHTLVVAEKQDGKVRVEAQKVSAAALRRRS